MVILNEPAKPVNEVRSPVYLRISPTVKKLIFNMGYKYIIPFIIELVILGNNIDIFRG